MGFDCQYWQDGNCIRQEGECNPTEGNCILRGKFSLLGRDTQAQAEQQNSPGNPDISDTNA